MLTSMLPLLFALAGGEEPRKAGEAPIGELSARVPAEGPELGDGYRKDAIAFEVSVGRAFGTKDTGSNFSHDLWLTELQGGFMLADVLEPNYWFGGNIEGIGKVIMAAQDNPDGAYLFGLNAGLRYHFQTGTPVAPFLTGSFGIGVTDIGAPDASGKFQFNEQIGAGARYLLSRQHAVTLEYEYWHVSNGGIRDPNDGVNAHIITLGFAWLF